MATKKTVAQGKSAPLDPKVADKLLDKLSTDNEFRRLFKKDPAAALAKVGHVIPAGQALGACSQVTHIAPKSEIVAAREAVRSHRTSAAAQTVIYYLEAGKVSASLSRK